MSFERVFHADQNVTHGAADSLTAGSRHAKGVYMMLDLERFDRVLSKGEHWVLHDARDLTLTCRRGCVWITQDQDQRDIILKVGESFTLDRNGPACVTAIEPTMLVAAAAHAYPAGELWARLAARLMPLRSRAAAI
jgi:hypothetical protein